MNPTNYIIIPAHNEQQHIAEVISKAKKYGSVIVVDDGSKDTTGEIALNNGAIVLTHLINMGKGAALKTGCDYAVQQNPNLLIALDADSQHDANDIPRFIENLKNVDIVFGHRELSQSMPALLRFGNKAINKITEWLFNVRLHDTQCGFRAFTPETYEKIRWVASNYSMESEMIANMRRANLTYKEIPIKTIYTDRFKGTTVIDGIKIVMNMVWWRLTR